MNRQSVSGQDLSAGRGGAGHADTVCSRNRRQGCGFLVALLLLAGCSGPAGQIDRREGIPHRVQVARDVTLERPGRARPLELRIAWPDAAGRFPVVVFSHGGGSSKDMYDRLADHWAAAGYVVVLPTHLDSAVYGFDMRATSVPSMLEIIETRRRDLSFIVDSLGPLQQQVPGLAGHVDDERLVVAGHSLGGATALTVSGLVIEDPRSGDRYGYLDARFDALLLITEPGNSPVLPAEPWRAARVPVFVATGSKDYSGQWQGPPKARLYDFTTGFEPPAGVPHHYLFIEGMDHYIGGLICRTDKGPPDPEALRLVSAGSTAFLDAYTKGDRRALALLRGTTLGERGTLSLR